MGIIPFIKNNKTTFFYISIIVILGIFFTRNYAYGSYYLPMRSDDGPEFSNIPSSDFAYHASNAYALKESLEHWEVPLWSKYTLSGMPLYAKPQVPAFNLTWLLLLIAPTSWLGLKWSFLFHFLLAGIGMYLFMSYYFKKNPKISFFTALIYMFNGNLNSEILVGHFNILNVYAFLPFIALFAVMALNEGKQIAYSITAGIFMSFLVLGGSPQEAIFALFFIIFFIALHTIGKNFAKRAVKALLCVFVILLVFFGLSAIKILPTLELLKIGPRQTGLSFESLVGDGIFKLNNFHQRIFNILGFPSVFLLLFIGTIKKKKSILLLGLLLFSILMLSKSPLIYAIWKYVPFVDKMRGIFKAVFMFVFPLSILAGIGISYLAEKCEAKFGAKKLRINIFYLALFVFLILSLAFPFQKEQKFADLKFQLGKNKIMQYMGNDKDISRFKVFETNGIDWGTDFYSIPLGLQDIYGYDNIWHPEYMPVFLSAANSQPAKFFGMLNMKYMASMTPLNISNFTLVRKFEECGKYNDGTDICQPRKSDGPYLYRNEMFLPRAFFAENSILVLGNEDNARSAVFYLLANANFDPSDTVVISQEKLDGIDSEILEKINIILLTQSPSQNDISRLRDYSRRGMLIPDIFSGQTEISVEQKIDEALKSLPRKSSIKKANVNYLGNDKLEIDAGGMEGFLVLSEQFSQYPGWKATLGNEEIKIFKASNILTSVFVEEGEEILKFEYHPKSWEKGKLISMATVAMIFLCLILMAIKSKKPSARNESNILPSSPLIK